MDTAGPPSRLPIDPSTHLPSIHSFGELSHYLRGSIADEDSRQLSESMARLASHSEAIIAGLRQWRQREHLAPMLMDFMTVLREHRNVVVGLDPVWRGLYEYAAYLQALNNFRVLIGQWLLDGGTQAPELRVTAEDFELVAWRTLGEGLLLIDMYEQWLAGALHDSSPAELLTEPPRLGQPTEPQVERAVAWWKRLRR